MKQNRKYITLEELRHLKSYVSDSGWIAEHIAGENKANEILDELIQLAEKSPKKRIRLVLE